MANNSNGVISKAGNAVMVTRGVKILGGPDPTGLQINPSNKMGFQVKNFEHPLVDIYFLFNLAFTQDLNVEQNTVV